jgi:hypothetical protein
MSKGGISRRRRRFQPVAELATAGLGSVVAGYAVTALALAGYMGTLLVRARRARERTAAIVAKRSR